MWQRFRMNLKPIIDAHKATRERAASEERRKTEDLLTLSRIHAEQMEESVLGIIAPAAEMARDQIQTEGRYARVRVSQEGLKGHPVLSRRYSLSIELSAAATKMPENTMALEYSGDPATGMFHVQIGSYKHWELDVRMHWREVTLSVVGDHLDQLTRLVFA